MMCEVQVTKVQIHPRADLVRPDFQQFWNVDPELCRYIGPNLFSRAIRETRGPAAGDCKLITLFPLDNPSRRGHMPCRHIDAPAQAACRPRANGSKWWSRGDSEDSTRARSAERDRTAQYCLKGRDSPQHRAATDIIDLEAKLAKVRISNVEVWVHFVYNCYANEGGVDQLSVTGHLGGWEPVVKPTSQRSVFCFGAGGRMQVNRLKPCGKPRCPRLGAPSCEFCLERRPRLCERRRSSRAVSRQLRVT